MSPLGSSFEIKIKEVFWALAGARIKSESPLPLRAGQPFSVLALRPDRLGDFILSAPALRQLLERAGPKARLTIVTGERNRQIAEFLFPEARILVFRKFFLNRVILFARLGLRHYDFVVDLHSFPFSTTSALMALFSGSPRRVGFWDSGKFKKLSKKVFNWGVPPPPLNLHEKDKSFLLVERIFRQKDLPSNMPFLVPRAPEKIRKRVEAFYKGLKLRGRERLIGIHPTLQKIDNRWLPEKYIELIRQLSVIPNLRVLVVHGRGEKKGLERFQALVDGIRNVFILPDDEVLFILEAAKKLDLFVCNDSGLAHLTALVTRVFTIFGPSEPGRWSPLDIGKGKPKIFRKKDKLCDSVTPKEVALEIRKALKR